MANEWAWRTPHAWTQEYADTPGRALERRPLLDRPSERHPILDALMDEALRRIVLTADGATMRLSARIKGEGGRSMAPVSGLASDLDRMGDEYLRCKTHRARLRVIKDAQDAWARLMFAPDRSKVRGTLEWKMAIAADPRPCRSVETVYGVGYRTIARVRKEIAARAA